MFLDSFVTECQTSHSAKNNACHLESAEEALHYFNSQAGTAAGIYTVMKKFNCDQGFSRNYRKDNAKGKSEKQDFSFQAQFHTC